MSWDDRRGTKYERGYGTEWIKRREYILARDEMLCQPCLAKNKLTKATEVDHIIPKAQGGTDDESNLQSICEDCHRDKTILDRGQKPRPRIDSKGNPDNASHWK